MLSAVSLQRSRKQQVRDNLRSALELWESDARRLAAVASLPRLPRSRLVQIVPAWVRDRVPHRPAWGDVGGALEQALRAPLAAMRAGGDCDDFTYYCGLLWAAQYGEDRRYLVWYPDSREPHHVACGVEVGGQLLAMDALRPYPLVWEASEDQVEPWPG